MEEEMEIKPRKVKVYFKGSYEYPEFKQDMIAVYDEEKDLYVLAEYTYCKDEEQLNEITMTLDNFKRRGIAYLKSQEGDESKQEKKESLLEKVSKMKK